MINKLSIVELLNAVFIFLFGVQIVSQSTFRILPIDTNALLGNASYIFGAFLIMKSIFVVKLNIYKDRISKHTIDFLGFVIGLFILIYGTHVIQTGEIHNKGPSIFYLSFQEKYAAGTILIFSGIYMISKSYVLWRRNISKDTN